jgi:hypothetical protein
MGMKKLVVTFTCNNCVHVYEQKSGKKPMPPYKIHLNEQNAVNYLKETRGIDEPKIIYKKS